MRFGPPAAALTLALAAPAAIAQNTPAAPAADPRDNASTVVDELAACRAITDNSQRLACFDRTAAALVAARDRKDIVVVDRNEVRRTRRSLFGFTLPRIRLFGGGDNDNDVEEVREVTSKVTSVRQVSYEEYRFKLEDGSEWETTQGTRGFPPRSGETVTIRRGALGSYMASFNDRIALRVKRIG